MVADARIFQPAKGATQSGSGRTKRWVLAFEPGSPRHVEPLMGWTASADMDQEVRLTFANKDAAVAFARKHGLSYSLDEPQRRRVRPKNYSDNFRYDRVFARGTGPARPDAAGEAEEVPRTGRR
mgnify:CR=1 FL=1